MKLKMPLLCAALVGAATAATSDAPACGYVDYREIRPIVPVQHKKPLPVAAIDRIAAGDQRLEEERAVEAGVQVVAAFPDIRQIAVGASPLKTRALRILSLAVVRGEGTLRGVPGFSGASERERGANLDWAVSTLRSIDASRPNDPVTQADLAEALATQTQHQDESLAILSDLASRDLVGSAHAYAALARLRATRGDASASRAALDRCEVMTKSPAVVCRAPDGRLAIRG
jgi:hypothetical protein